MFVKFTNAFERFKGNPIYINTYWISSVFEHVPENPEEGNIRTMIYGSPKGEVWEVEESLNEVIKLINECKKNDRS